MSEIRLDKNEVEFLLSPMAIRDRAKAVYDYTLAGRGKFIFHEEKFKSVVEYVLKVIQKNYPDGKIPFHSRWGHFRAGGIDRSLELKKKIAALDPIEQARIQLDLVVTSVLLDAGAGATWKYFEESSQKTYNRSEGLGVASYHMFLSGIMSSDKKSLRADAEGLKSITAKDIRQFFQVTSENPLLGVEGRVQLLNNLGRAMENKTLFKDGRPGNIVDALMAKSGKMIFAKSILRTVLDGFGSIWPGRLSAHGVNLGDVWQHSQLSQSTFGALVPFHKLSQWMTYSLIEPMQDAGLTIIGVEELTGLAEYRNGGLLLDSGLVSLRDPSDQNKKWEPGSDLIIEWRALTVFLLDRIGAEVQKALGKTQEEFPLAKVLEGGTWWAGRFLAQEKRENGDPPLQIQSDGTVF